jgi:RNA recognition motif-containing protein
MNIYIANLDSTLKNEDLKNLFAPYGEIDSAEIAMDAFTDKPRGFGYVEMPNDDQAQSAIEALNQSELSGHKLLVQKAERKEQHRGSYKVGNGAVNVFKFRKN